MKAFLLAGLATALSLQAQPRVQRFTLPNGLQVLHLEDHEQPLVRAQLHLSLEPGDTPPGRQGIPLLVQRMFSHSETVDLKAEDVDQMLDDSGLQLTSASTSRGLDWRLVARSRDQDRALGLLADRLLRAAFDPTVLEAQRLACWLQEERLDDPPRARLRWILTQDPAARPTLSSLGAITLEDILRFRAKVFRPDRAVLVLHGDLSLEQAKRMVLLSFGSWTIQLAPQEAKPAPGGALAHPATPAENRFQIAAPGTELRVMVVAPQPGNLPPEVTQLLGLLLPGDADFAPAWVEMGDGFLVATLDGASGSGLSSLLHARLEALRQRGFTQSDLDRARVAWLARRSLDCLHPETQLDLALAEAMGQAATQERMQALTLEALNASLRRWLDPVIFRVGVAGDPDQLKAFATP